MKNRNPLTKNHNVYLENIINSKLMHRKTILTNSLPFLLNKFKEYRKEFNSNTLESLSTIGHSPDLREALKHCYSVSTKPLDSLKLAIKQKQDIALSGLCPYCTIKSPDETDHYVGEEEFPEFAVLALNLIPCCSSCNKIKGKWWRIHGKRAFLNFYLDKIPNDQYVFVDITFIKKNKIIIPVAKFVLNLTGLAKSLADIIENHYKRLDLLRKFSDAVADEFATLSRNLTTFKFKEEYEVKDYLKDLSEKEKKDCGANHWRAVYLAELALKPKFLKSVI